MAISPKQPSSTNTNDISKNLLTLANKNHQLATTTLNIVDNPNPKKKYEKDDYLNALQQNSFFRGLQTQFFRTAISPIGSAIIDVCVSYYDAMTPALRKELCDIGMEIASLPYKVISGEKSLKTCFDDFVGSLKKLTEFFKKNVEISFKAGTDFLKSLLPMGSFLESAAKLITNAALPKGTVEPVLKGLSTLTSNYDALTTALEQTPTAKTKISKR